MEKVAPLGPVYQAGTLSGNPLAVAGGLAMLRTLRGTPGLYESLDAKGARLQEGIAAAAKKTGVPVTINRIGSMFTVFFNPNPVTDFDGASASDTERFARFFRGLLQRGVYLPCSQFEATFASTAHTEDQLDEAIAAAEDVLRELKD